MKDRGILDLGEWMYKNDITCEQMAKKIGSSTSTINLLVRGKVPQNIINIYKIEKLTKGQVLLKNIVEKGEKKKQSKEQSDTDQQQGLLF